MRVEDLTSEHLRRIKVRNYELADLGDTIPREDYLGSEYKKAVLREDGEVILVCGGHLIKQDIAWVWIVASDLIYENPVLSLEILLNLQEEGARLLKPRICYTWNHPNGIKEIRFLERLGFTQRDRKICHDGQERIAMVKEYSWEE